MDNETWTQWNNSLREKLGDENYSIISGDLGELLTRNNETMNRLDTQATEIETLKANNQKLSNANAQLLQQLPVIEKSSTSSEIENENDNASIDWKTFFDANGKFIR